MGNSTRSNGGNATDADVHRTVSADGTEIAGSVHGNGQPLVLVPGAMSDGETVWEPLVPLLTDRFTCYAMSTRGRGLSDESADLSLERLVEDVTAFAESVGDPVGLMGWSGGAMLSLAAAQQTDAVSAVAAYEPPAFEVVTDDVSERMMETIERVSEAAAAERLVDAVRIWVEFVATDDELAAAAERGFFEALAPNVPVQLREFEQLFESGVSGPTDPAALATIDVPVLLLHGDRSIPEPWMVDSVRHVARYVDDVRVREVDGAGHLGPGLEPDAVADELGRFFAATPDPV